MTQHRKKIFGVAFDASDDPWSLQLKWASMMAVGNNVNLLLSDPYDVLAKDITDLQHFELAGKFPLPSWLGPRPQPSDRHLVNAETLQQFVANGGLLKTMKRLQNFIQSNIFPAFPIMVGIDHSATGGVISALAKRYGPDMMSVVVLDRHFDAIPLSLRMDSYLKGTSYFNTNSSRLSGDDTELDQYCCGNFWAYLMNAGILLPENLLMIGVADYPSQEIDPHWRGFRESYLSFEERGCTFFPQWKFDGWYIDSLTNFIHDKITTPYVYVSLDLDVGSYHCINAARYMDGPGINRQNILDIVDVIAEGSRKGSYELVGFDIMEFNIHFLGIKTAEGGEDSTLPLVQDFIRTLALA